LYLLRVALCSKIDLHPKIDHICELLRKIVQLLDEIFCRNLLSTFGL
jgi:hypothetical protein